MPNMYWKLLSESFKMIPMMNSQKLNKQRAGIDVGQFEDAFVIGLGY